MAPKLPFQYLLSLILLAFSSIGHAKGKGVDIISGKNPSSISSFDFIKELGGCQKGTKSECIQRLRLYLNELGYLPQLAQSLKSNYFDNALESAIKTYQQNFQIKPSGTLDSTTASTMMAPRCGVPDIVNGTNYMQQPPAAHNKKWRSSSTNIFHTVSHYDFIPGNKWRKRRLSYRFLSGFPTFAMPPVRRALQKWAIASEYFEFFQVESSEFSDLKIGFYRRSHGDREPFDGPGRVLAHAWPPPIGTLHFDADERWFVGPGGPKANENDLETVAVHEIGHLLGLEHSQVPEAIMYPRLDAGITKSIQDDDIQGIRALYI